MIKFNKEIALDRKNLALKDHNSLAIDIVEKIAKGDNNPRVTAQEFMDEYERLKNLPVEHWLQK